MSREKEKVTKKTQLPERNGQLSNDAKSNELAGPRPPIDGKKIEEKNELKIDECNE